MITKIYTRRSRGFQLGKFVVLTLSIAIQSATADDDTSIPSSSVLCDDAYADIGNCRESVFSLNEINIYPTFSYLDDKSATYTEFEFASHTRIGQWQMENRTVLNVADLPGEIRLGPTNPGEPTVTQGVRGNGFGDTLSGFFFSKPNHERNWDLGLGTVWTFPSATNELLGSGQFTVGPGAHFHTEWEKLSGGFFLWQSWSYADAGYGKRVNQMFGKPFIIYEASEDWHLVSIPLGMSHSWEKPSGDDWTVPVGGGLRRLINCGDHQLGLQFQAFDYVARKPTDPEWEIRTTVEFILN